MPPVARKAQAPSRRARGGTERLGTRRESAGDPRRGARPRARRGARARRGGPTPGELEAACQRGRRSGTGRCNRARRPRRARRARRGSGSRRSSLDRRARRALTRRARAGRAGETLALSELEAEPGTERAIAAALASVRPRCSPAARARPPAGRACARGRARQPRRRSSIATRAARPARRGRAAAPRARGGEPAALRLDGCRSCRSSGCSTRARAAVTVEGLGFDAERGELWFAGETAEAVLLEMDARRRALAEEAEELDAPRNSWGRGRRRGRRRGGGAEAGVCGRRPPPRADRRPGVRSLARSPRPSTTSRELPARPRERLEAPLAARPTAGAERSGSLGAELQRLSSSRGPRAGRRPTARAQTAEVVVARLGGSLDELRPTKPTPRDQPARNRPHAGARRGSAARGPRRADRACHAEAALSCPHRVARRRPGHPRPAGSTPPWPRGRPRSRPTARRAVRSTRPCPRRRRVQNAPARLGDEFRRLGATEVEVRQGADEAGERLTSVEVELARLDGEAEEARRRLDEAGAHEHAVGDDRDELAGACRTTRLAARGTRQGEPAGQGGVRGGEGAARGARDAAAGSRGVAGRDREASRRARRDGAAALRRDVRDRRPQLRGGGGDAVPGRRGPAAPRRAGSRTTRATSSRPGVELEIQPAGKRARG